MMFKAVLFDELFDAGCAKPTRGRIVAKETVHSKTGYKFYYEVWYGKDAMDCDNWRSASDHEERCMKSHFTIMQLSKILKEQYGIEVKNKES
jgi:hypothetical protein